MKIADQLHLTYCSNIHAGEQWSDVDAALRTSLPQIRRALGHCGPFAVGLRLSAEAARALGDEDAFARFRDFLQAGDYYVPTINGFPYGAFHGSRVKERVYEPDWRHPARLDYTNQLARIGSTLASDARLDRVSISTVPGAFRPNAMREEDRAAITVGFLAHAAFVKQLFADTGVTVTLAIEPEPACCLETVDELITFFREYLLASPHLARASAVAGIELNEDDVRRHLGVCLDACHMAVEFEDPSAALQRLRAEGVAIAKVQLSSALRVADSGRAARVLLSPFAEDIYLHQVVIQRDGQLLRYTDLPEALHAAGNSPPCGEWRVHFHVPIFLESVSEFATTQAYLTSLLALLKQEPVATCLEFETYTWSVLPAEYRTTDMCSAIARELTWVRDRLA